MKIAFTPAVYEHAARFVGRTPWEVSRDPDLKFEGHRRVYVTPFGGVQATPYWDDLVPFKMRSDGAEPAKAAQEGPYVKG